MELKVAKMWVDYLFADHKFNIWKGLHMCKFYSKWKYSLQTTTSFYCWMRVPKNYTIRSLYNGAIVFILAGK